MKKIGLLAGVFIFLALSGCKEKETGLQKEVLNSAINDCTARLGNSLKSPSSLKISEVLAATYIPKPGVINRVASNILIDKESGQISELMQRLKVRYRELGLSIQYEAQNSFGVYLKGKFNCSYIYQLTSDKTSPEDNILLSKLGNNNEYVEINNATIQLNGNSNFILDSRYDRIIGDAPVEQIQSDLDLLEQVQTNWNTQKELNKFPTQEIDNLN